jgi:hypothetical protein
VTDSMTDQLKQLSEAATPGLWGQYHGSNGPWQDQAKETNRYEWDSSHDMSAMTPHAGRYRIGQFRRADTAAFVEALVNAYRAGELIPASEARAQVAVAYEVAADEAERYAGYYQQGSDGRNTFVIFADLMRQKAAEANQ